MRRGINQHTLEKICRGEPVRSIKLVKCLSVLDDVERVRLGRRVRVVRPKKMVERDPKEYALKLRTDRRDQLHVGSVGRRNLKS